MFDRNLVQHLAQRYERFFLYDERILLSRLRQLRSAIPWADFLYSVKANPHPQILNTVFRSRFGADASSLGEIRLCLEQGLTPESIFYSAPGKSGFNLEGAFGRGVLVADSLTEVARIQALAIQRDMPLEIGLRINPDFTMEKDGGTPSKFGVDEEQLWSCLSWLHSLSHVRVSGIHVHLRSQVLDAAVMTCYYEEVFKLAKRMVGALNRPLSYLNLGSGLGIPYAREESPLDVSALGVGASSVAEIFHRQFPQTWLLIETGRFLVGQAGIYVTRVADVKTSRGKRFAILDGTLNAFARPVLAQLAAEWASSLPPEPHEPLYTCPSPFQIHVLTDETETEPVTLTGNLCTAADTVGRDLVLPKLKAGDAVVFTHAGAYGASLSPDRFASMERTPELFLTEDGQLLA